MPCYEIDVLFDLYPRLFNKATTRSRPLRIRQGMCAEFLKEVRFCLCSVADEVQADLALFSRKQLLTPQSYTFVQKNGTFSNPSLDVTILRSNNEEADTRFFLHAVSLNVYRVCRQRSGLLLRYRCGVASPGYWSELERMSRYICLWTRTQQIFLPTH